MSRLRRRGLFKGSGPYKAKSTASARSGDFMPRAFIAFLFSIWV
ncbi:hypothetical protein OG235_07665 [Streptomyces sp. NBC_00024]